MYYGVEMYLSDNQFLRSVHLTTHHFDNQHLATCTFDGQFGMQAVSAVNLLAGHYPTRQITSHNDARRCQPGRLTVNDNCTSEVLAAELLCISSFADVCNIFVKFQASCT